MCVSLSSWSQEVNKCFVHEQGRVARVSYFSASVYLYSCIVTIQHDDQESSGRSKLIKYGGYAFKPLRRIQRARIAEYQSNSSSHSPMCFIWLMTSVKSSTAIELCLTILKYSKTFYSLDMLISYTLVKAGKLRKFTLLK